MAQKKRIKRKWTRRIHLWLGLTTGPIVLLLSITGCIYVFQQEITSFLREDAIYANTVTNKTLKIDEVWVKVDQSLENGAVLSNVNISNDSNKNWVFTVFNKSKEDAITYFGGIDHWLSIYVNPYTGEIEKTINEEEDFFNTIKLLHWSLLLKTEYGQPIVGWATFLFLILLVSGIILWWPYNKNAKKQRFSFEWKKSMSWKRKNYDLHSILGFYVSLLLLVFALTGLVWAFAWFKATIYEIGEKETSQNSLVNEIHRESFNIKYPLHEVFLESSSTFPDASKFRITPSEVISVSVQQDEGMYAKMHSQQYDSKTLQLLSEVKHVDKHMGEKLVTANYDIHVGAILGLPGKILAFIASLICASLPITGFLVWMVRTKKI